MLVFRTMAGGCGTVCLACLLVCCGGRSTRDAEVRAQGGSSGSTPASAGGTLGAGAASATGGAALSAGSPSVAGQPTAGGSPSVGGAPSVDIGVGGQTSGAAGVSASAGAAGEPPLVDHERARWPMPNSVSSGLPHPLSYDLASADVVTDNVTGLVWERISVSAPPVSFAAETAHCAALSLAGHKHWRLPTLIELISLMAAVDDTLRDEDFPNLRVAVYMSSSRFTDDADPSMWRVNLARWRLDREAASSGGYGRCVWSDDSRVTDPSPPVRELKQNVVVDTSTGLTWERTPGFTAGSYADAAAYCASLSLGGFDDWRMPSMQELMSLVELRQVAPAINTSDFPGDLGLNAGGFWTATRYPPGGFFYAPGLSFDLDEVDGWSAQSELAVRCVR